MMGRMRRLASRVGLVAMLTLSGCASWFMKGEAPEVLVTNVTPLDASAFEQRLQVVLDVVDIQAEPAGRQSINRNLQILNAVIAQGVGVLCARHFLYRSFNFTGQPVERGEVRAEHLDR